MIRVTKAEVKKALEKNLESREYCICSDCLCAFQITDEEWKEYHDLRCGNCSTEDFYYAGYDVGLVDSIIDPEPHGTIEINLGNTEPTHTCESPNSVTNEELLKLHDKDINKNTYKICANCGVTYKYNYDPDDKIPCKNCGGTESYYANLMYFINKYRKPTQPQEQYVVGTLHVGNHIYTFEEANLKADEAAKNTQGEKVLVLKVINTRIATSKIEYERS